MIDWREYSDVGAHFQGIPRMEARMKVPEELFKYTKVGTGKEIISGLSLRATQPDQFNDPFEFLPSRYKKVKPKDVRKMAHSTESLHRYHDVLRAAGKFTDSFKKFKYFMRNSENAAPIIEKATEGIKNRDFLDFVTEFSRHFGVICFTPSPSNILMWSHYADMHRGMAIGFRPELLVKQHGYNWHEVHYSDHRVVLPFQPKSEDEQRRQTNDLISTKAECWDYEEEWRVLARLRELEQVEDTDIFLMPFPPGAITRVIVGFKAGSDCYDAVHDCVRNALGAGVAVQKAELDKECYAVVVPELTDGTAHKPGADCSVQQQSTSNPSPSRTEG